MISWSLEEFQGHTYYGHLELSDACRIETSAAQLFNIYVELRL